MTAPRKLDVYALSQFTRVEITDHEVRLTRLAGSQLALTRSEWIALVDVLLPHLTDATRSDLTAEIARGSTGHTT